VHLQTEQEVIKMQTTLFLFVRRQHGYQLVPGGMGVIAKPEDGIYLTLTCDEKVTPPADVLSPDQMAAWLKELRESQCSLRAVDGYGKPLDVNPDGDR
jgi:hypothetical protein